MRQTNVLLTLASFVVVVAGMRTAQVILVPFLLAAFLAILCAPAQSWLQRRRLPAGLSVLVILIGLAAVLLFLVGLLGTPFTRFMAGLPEYETQLRAKAAELVIWLKDMGVTVPDEGLLETLDPGAVLGLFRNLLAGIGAMLTNAVLILITMSFIMLEASTLPNKLRAVMDDPDALDEILGNVRHYMGIKACFSLLTGALVAALLFLLGIEYPMLFGLLAFALNFIPTIGSIIAAIPALLVGIVQVGPGKTMIAAVGYLLINQIISNLIEVRFMGKGLGLSMLVVFLSLVFWGWVLGPIGMLLSVPITMTIKIVLDGHERTRWLAVLLSSGRAAARRAQG